MALKDMKTTAFREPLPRQIQSGSRVYSSLDWIWTPDPVDFQNVTGTSLSEDI